MCGWKRLLKVNTLSGFSLVESAVAIAAVAAVVVITVGGSAVIQRSKLGSIVSDIEGFSKAIIYFEEKYKGLPGDTASVANLTGATVGDADGTIDTAAEALQVWQHLSLAGLIKGKFDGTSTNVPGTGVPEGPIKSSGYNALIPTAVDAKLNQAFIIELSGFTSSSNSQPILTPEDAKAIDEKMDDGYPNKGLVRGVDSAGDNSTTNCATGSGATDTYNVNSKPLGCRLRFIIRTSAQADDAIALTDKVTDGCHHSGLTRESEDAGDVCPVGTIGQIMKTCRIDTTDNKGAWEISASYCQPVICSGGKKYGEKRVLPCMSGQIGTGIVQTCSAEGVWVTGGALNTTAPYNSPNADGTTGCSLPSNDALYTCSPDNLVRAPQACNWTQTGMVRQTCGTETTGRWSTTSDTCSLVTCAGGTVGGTKAGTACSGNYAGATVETCTMNGTWQVTSNKCLPIIKTGACTVGVTPDSDLGCPLGEVGNNLQRCIDSASNTWAPIGSTCKPMNCSGERIGESRVVKGAKCPNGRTGVMVEVCVSDGEASPTGKWTPFFPDVIPTAVISDDTVPITNHCATVMCDGPGNQDGNATWQYEAADGGSKNGTCISGYSGTPTRVCNSSGVWQSVTGACTRTTCTSPDQNATWTTPVTKTTNVKGVCSWPDYEGMPTRDCDLTGAGGGAWSSGTKSPCQPSALPVKNGLQLWLDAADYSTVFSDSTCTTSSVGGGGVSCWKDKSGNGKNATLGQAPLYTSGAINNKPALTFDGAKSLTTTSTVLNTDLHSIFVVANNTETGSEDILGTGGTSAGDILIMNYSVVGKYRGHFWTNTDSNIVDSTAATIENKAVIYEQIVDATKIYTLRNGAFDVNGTALVGTKTGATRNIIVGGRSTSASSRFTGTIAEILVYDSALSLGDRSDVEVYLANKWGISISPPVTAGLTLWLDGADDANIFTGSDCTGAVSHGSVVGCWKDKSGSASGTNFILGDGPIYNKNLSNTGNSGLTFNGTSDYLVAAVTTNKYDYPTSAAYTFIAALKSNSTSATGIIFSKYNGGVAGQYYLRQNVASGFEFHREKTPYKVSGTSVEDLLPHVVTGMYDGTLALKLWVDTVFTNTIEIGTVVTNTVAPTIGASYTSGTPVSFLNADMYEFLVYGATLSASQRVAVETFLMRKWGIDVPVPLATSGLKLWLDAHDQGSLIINSNCTTGFVDVNDQVGCWMDKSRNGEVVRQSVSAAKKPLFRTALLNGKPLLDFDGVDDYLEVTGTGTFLDKDITMFAVVQVIGVADGTRIGNIIGNYSNGTTPYLNIEGHTTGRLRTYWNTGSPSYYSSDDIRGSGGEILTVYRDIGTNTLAHYMNSSLSGSTTAGSTVTYVKPFKVGDDFRNATSAGIPFKGNMGEIILYDRSIAATERCDVEKYLGLKWGIYTVACAAVATAPLVPNGLVLWLDANDATTLYTSSDCVTGANPATTNTIGCWKDKSGSNNHAVQSTSANRPAYTTNVLNSKPILRLDGTDYLQTPSITLKDQQTFLMVLRSVNTSAGADNNFFRPNSGGSVMYVNNSYSEKYAMYNGTVLNSETVATNDTAIITGIFNSTASSMYRNGVLIASGNAGSTSTTNPVNIGAGTSGATQYTGDMAEFLIYNRVLSTAERQNVENALGYKWGIEMLPVVSPVLWLDAADNSTLFTNSNCSTGGSPVNNASIACWKDKSASAANFTTGAAPNYLTSSVNGKGGINFNGTSQYLEKSYTANLNPAANTLFVVSKPTGHAGNYRSPITSRDASPLRGFMAYANSVNLWDVTVGSSSVWGGPGILSGAPATLSAPAILTHQFTNASQNAYVNGALKGSNTSTYAVNTVRPTRVGAGRTESTAIYFFSGDVNEIILYNSVLSAANRSTMESYLGNKWGISISAPLTTNLKLWLDAADLSTLYQNANCSTSPVTADAQSVACWKDKSGTDNHATATAAPLYKTGIANGLPILRFNGSSQYFSLPDSTMPTGAANYSWFSVYKADVATGQTPFGAGGVEASDRQVFIRMGAGPELNTGWWSDNLISSGSALDTTNYFVVSSLWDGTDRTQYVNGIAAGADQPTGKNTSATRNFVGGVWSGAAVAGFFDGDIAEMMIYSDALSDTDRTIVERYLGEKWAISVQ